MTSAEFKVRENRIRRVAERRGLAMTKTRRRDPRAVDYGHYYLACDGLQILDAASLDEVEQFLDR